jgi:hypothetical protein
VKRDPYEQPKLRGDRWAWAGWPNRHMLRRYQWMKRVKRRRLNFQPAPPPLEREAQRAGKAYFENKMTRSRRAVR